MLAFLPHANDLISMLTLLFHVCGSTQPPTIDSCFQQTIDVFFCAILNNLKLIPLIPKLFSTLDLFIR